MTLYNTRLKYVMKQSQINNNRGNNSEIQIRRLDACEVYNYTVKTLRLELLLAVYNLSLYIDSCRRVCDLEHHQNIL